MGSLRVYGIDPESIVDGPGIRYAIFTQGCRHACPGCHNPESHAFDGGQMMDIDAIVEDVKAHRIIKDVTLSGGDPFEQPEACAELAKKLKDAGYNIWVFTGYVYEDLANYGCQHCDNLLSYADVLVDGPYIQAQRSLELEWKGSANQRVIDLKKMRESGDMNTIILWSNKYEPPAHPNKW